MRDFSQCHATPPGEFDRTLRTKDNETPWVLKSRIPRQSLDQSRARPAPQPPDLTQTSAMTASELSSTPALAFLSSLAGFVIGCLDRLGVKSWDTMYDVTVPTRPFFQGTTLCTAAGRTRCARHF